MSAPAAAAKRPSGRHILGLVVLLWALTPVGLWKLWRDPELSSTAKWRILVYSFVIPILAYFALSFWKANEIMTRYLP